MLRRKQGIHFFNRFKRSKFEKVWKYLNTLARGFAVNSALIIGCRMPMQGCVAGRQKSSRVERREVDCRCAFQVSMDPLTR